MSADNFKYPLRHMSSLIFWLCFLTHQASLCWTALLVDSWRTSVAGLTLTRVTPRPLLVPAVPCHLLKSWAPSGRHRGLRLCFACSSAGGDKFFPGQVLSLWRCLILNSSCISPGASEKKIAWECFPGIHPFQISTHAYPRLSASSSQWLNDFAKVPFEKLGLGGLMDPTKSHSLSFSPFYCLYTKLSRRNGEIVWSLDSNKIRNLWILCHCCSKCPCQSETETGKSWFFKMFSFFQ